MGNSPHQLKHKKEKAIRKAGKEEEYATEASRMSEKKKKTYLTSTHVSKIARAKASSTHKHHPNIPGEIEGKINPESLHQEGEHWVKNVKRKTLYAADRLKTKLQKLHFFGRKK